MVYKRSQQFLSTFSKTGKHLLKHSHCVLTCCRFSRLSNQFQSSSVRITAAQNQYHELSVSHGLAWPDGAIQNVARRDNEHHSHANSLPTVMAKILFCTFDLRHDWLSIKVQHFKVHNFPHSDKHIPAVTAPPVPRLQPWRSLWGLFLATHMALFHFIFLY